MFRVCHLLLPCVLVFVLWTEESSAQPIWDRVTQLVFEPNRLNYWYNVYEKLFHLGRYHVHNLPKVMALPFHGAQKALVTFYNLQHSQQLS